MSLTRIYFTHHWHYKASYYGYYKLSRYKGSGWNEKLPRRRISTVEIVRKVLSTQTQLSHKCHHHGGVVCPSYGVVSLNAPNRRETS